MAAWHDRKARQRRQQADTIVRQTRRSMATARPEPKPDPAELIPLDLEAMAEQARAFNASALDRHAASIQKTRNARSAAADAGADEAGEPRP